MLVMVKVLFEFVIFNRVWCVKLLFSFLVNLVIVEGWLLEGLNGLCRIKGLFCLFIMFFDVLFYVKRLEFYYKVLVFILVVF